MEPLRDRPAFVPPQDGPTVFSNRPPVDLPDEFPAVAVQVGRAEQSRAFAWVNSQTIKVSAFHVLKAALTAEEDWALRADRAVSDAGCRLMTYHASAANKKPGEVYCVTLIRRLITRTWTRRSPLPLPGCWPARRWTGPSPIPTTS